MSDKRFDLVCKSNLEWLLQSGLFISIKDKNTNKKITLQQCYDLLNNFAKENQDNKAMIKFLDTENNQIMNELKTRTQIQHQLEEENEKLESKLKDCEKTKKKRMRIIKHQRAVLEEMGAVNIGYKGQLKQLNHKIKRIKELLNDKTALSKFELMEILE